MGTLLQTQPHQSKIYYEFSHLYDRIFTRVFFPRIAAVIQSLSIPPAARVLEVGVGTGLSLEAYPPHCHVTGIDLAPDMLEIAQEKIDRQGWRHIHLAEMDAQNLTFPENTFDYAMAFHVVSVVPQAELMMRELARVCKPGATVVIINHFRSRHRLFAKVDAMIEPITSRLGWRTLRLTDVLGPNSIRSARVFKTSRHSLFTVVIATNQK
jgi:phosphatidylethanolamine/phosphatidyl-N-methylethanolamine N-methyltransferase